MKGNHMAEIEKRVLLLFLYGEHNGYYVREEGADNLEASIRYWMGKSPGIHRNEMEHIYVVPADAPDMIGLLDKLRDEELAFEKKQRESAERAEFERLKKKFV